MSMLLDTNLQPLDIVLAHCAEPTLLHPVGPQHLSLTYVGTDVSGICIPR